MKIESGELRDGLGGKKTVKAYCEQDANNELVNGVFTKITKLVIERLLLVKLYYDTSFCVGIKWFRAYIGNYRF